MNKSFKEFFSFSKAELNGLLVFCFLLILVAFAPLMYSYLNPPEVYDYSSFKKEIQTFRASITKSHPDNQYSADRNNIEEEFSADLFNFDPNNLPASQWTKLGLSDKQIEVIKNYESKGGRFYKKEDLKKIYSIRPWLYKKLEPFIRISAKADTYKASYVNSYKKAGDQKIAIVDINLSDSAQLETLKGIGPAFAARIVKYRNRLGGFYKKEQLKEVYGLDSAIYQNIADQISLSQGSVKQISINAATFDDLKKHPYLTFKQMNAIIQYRKQHGEYKDISDLKQIAILNDGLLKKIEPYLSFK